MENDIYSSPSSTKSIDENRGNYVRKFFNSLSLKSQPRSYEIEPSKTFIVQTIGTVERSIPGEEGLDECLKSLYSSAIKTDDLLRVKISISSNCVTMRGLGGKLIEDQQDQEVIVPFGRITYIGGDRKHQLFAFNDQVSNKPRKVITYAFLCNDAESSSTIVETLKTAFQEKHGRRSSRRNRQFSDTI